MKSVERLGFIGAGNMTQAVLSGLSQAEYKMDSVLVSNRSPQKLEALKESFGIQKAKSNEEVVDQSDIVFLAMKPHDLKELLPGLGKSFISSQYIVSFAAGVAMEDLSEELPLCKNIFRVIPSSPNTLGMGVVGFYAHPEALAVVKEIVKNRIQSLGHLIEVESEEQLDALMVGTSSGVGFVYEFMQIWQEWLEDKGFSVRESQNMTIETFLGAAQLAFKSDKNFVDLQNQVATKKGVTAEALESMRSMDLDRVLRVAFESGLLKNKKL